MRPSKPTKEEVLAGTPNLPAVPDLPRDAGKHFVRNKDVMLRFLEGQSLEDIAAAKQITLGQVKGILRRSDIKGEIQRLAMLANDRYIQERVDGLTIEALDMVRDTMRGVNFSELRFKAAKEMLDKSPILRQKADGALDEVGRGIGEAIITRLAQLESEKARVQHEEAQVIAEGSSDEEAS